MTKTEAKAVSEDVLRMKLTMMTAIKNRINEKGWTQKEVAKMLNTGQARVSNLVTGKHEVFSLEKLLWSAHTLGVRFEFTLTDANGNVV